MTALLNAPRARLTNTELRELLARRGAPVTPAWRADLDRRQRRAAARRPDGASRSCTGVRDLLATLEALGGTGSYADIVDALRADGLPGSYTTVRKRLKDLVAAGAVTRPAGQPHPIPFTLTDHGRERLASTCPACASPLTEAACPSCS